MRIHVLHRLLFALVIAALLMPLLAHAQSAPTLTVAWTAPTQNTDGSAITAALTYNLFSGPSGQETQTQTGLTAVTVVVNGTAGVQACFQVQAVAAGVTSALSAEACGTPPAPTPKTPNPPTNVTVASVPPPGSATVMIGPNAPAGSPTSILEASGAVDTVVAGVVQRGGVPLGVSANVVLLVYTGGNLWQEINTCLLWEWSGTSWITPGAAAGTNNGTVVGPAGVTLPACKAA